METVKIKLEGKEVEIPKADLDWFVKEKGATVSGTKSESKSTEKKETK